MDRSEFGWEDVVAIWSEIRVLARWLLSKERQQYSWRPTSLTTDALRRLHQRDGQWVEVRWQDKQHFVNCCLKAMRSALSDRHRNAAAARRPPVDYTVSIDVLGTLSPERIVTHHLDAFISFQQAVDHIALNDPETARLLEVRYICGYTPAEAAVLMSYSDRQMRRLYAKAKLKLDEVLLGD